MNGFIFTVVHLTAELTSLSDEISPVQLLLAKEGRAVENVKRETRVNQNSIANEGDQEFKLAKRDDEWYFIPALGELFLP